MGNPSFSQETRDMFPNKTKEQDADAINSTDERIASMHIMDS
jgi:hypothetical protein